jgi:hypothetical protein
MSNNIFKNLNIDHIDIEDPRYQKLKETFTEEIKKRFTCEDYEPIVK